MRGDYEPRDWTRIASTVLKRSLGLRRGQSVIIRTWAPGLAAAEIFEAEAHRLGIRPLILYAADLPSAGSRRSVNPDGEAGLTKIELAAIEASDGYIVIPAFPEGFGGRSRSATAHRRAFQEREWEWYRALVRKTVPSVFLHAATATRAAAREYAVNFPAWRRETVRASSIDPLTLQLRGKPLMRSLREGRHVRIVHPNGTKLDLGLRGNSPVLDDGRIDKQDLAEGRVFTMVPGGVISVALDERVAEGQLIANRPSRHRRGPIEGMTWTFRRGRLVSSRMREGRTIFEDSYRHAGPERDRPAILSVGLNPEIQDFPLAEDQAEGVVTLYVGHNDDYGGRTAGTYREYALLQRAELFIDDRPILRPR
jgi:leucyl aminopeptidase (aminopeptidase T)